MVLKERFGNKIAMYLEQILRDRDAAIEFRNERWSSFGIAPNWVNTSEVGLDQFFTTEKIAAECYNEMLAFLRENGEDESQFHHVEPSAGSGAFFDLMPPGRRTGIDILPVRREFIRNDFLTWRPQHRSSPKCLVIGNPPFGYRAWLALAFVNHAAKFADHIGMILPMAFQSDGKGSPKHRVEGMTLKSSRILPPDSFVDAGGKSVKVNALWQIWSKGTNQSARKVTCKDWVDLFTVDQRKERLCGQAKMANADFFLQRTFYKDPPSLVKCFSQVRYVCGYGFIIKKKKRELTSFLKSVDWHKYSNLAAHNCRHISMYHIERALADGGYVDA